MKQLAFVAGVLFSITLFAQQSPDTLTISRDIDDVHIFDNLDSLYNLWYVKRSEENGKNDYHKTAQDTSVPEFSDSIYMQRLQNLNVLVPLSFNQKVRRYIDVYAKERRNQVEIMLGLAEYYFPIFEQVLDQYHLPLELKYMPVIESALNTRAISRAGATGIWQFMYGTGKMYNLEINTFVDERRDPVKASYAAAKYLKGLYNIYKDWILVIAAYNCGPGNVNKAIRRSGGNKDYWEIYYRLPRETRGYVPAFIAATYIMNYNREHNLFPRKVDFPVLTDTLMIEEELHLEQVAHVLQIPLQQIRDLNPQYKVDILPAKTKAYPLRLPFEYTSKFIDLQDSIFNYFDTIYFNGEIKVEPKPYSATRYVPPPPTGKEKLFYTVKSGDNIGYISEWFHVRTADIRYWNDICRNLIRSGQKLVIYVPKGKAEKYKKIDSMTFEQKQRMIGATVKKEEKESKPVDKKNGKYIYYTVKWGDTLWGISKKFDGVSDTDIKKWNNIIDVRDLEPGQKLKILVN